VLSTPPAFVLSQDQTLQTKTREKPDQKQKPHPDTETSEHGKKQQQNKTTKHTIEFSNNTASRRPRSHPAVIAAS
jgi:hypothetical protein